MILQDFNIVIVKQLNLGAKKRHKNMNQNLSSKNLVTKNSSSREVAGWLGGCVVLNGDASKVFPFLDNSEQLQFSNN